jgi:hypothetical protein
VIIRHDLTGIGSVSWFRAYHVGLVISDAPTFMMSGQAAARLSPIDAVGHYFFDIQALRSGQVARARYLPEIWVTGGFAHGDRTAEFTGRVQMHILAHVSGFVCLRPTIRFDECDPQPADSRLLHHLERSLWDLGQVLSFDVAGAAKSLTGNMRALLNWVFLDLITRWAGMPESAERLSEWAREGPFGCERLHKLAREGRIDFPFPVSFGTQFEIAESQFASLSQPKADELAARLAHEILRGRHSGSDAPPSDVEHDAARVWWYVEESQALTLTGASAIDPGFDVIDPDRTQLLEWMTIRRGALRSVQRETQRILSAGSKISKARIETWYHILATTTDDYVLDDRIGKLIKPLQAHNAEDRRLRDQAQLEIQVRGNLESFQRRLDATGAWVSSVIGALVGAGALVIGLNSVTLSVLSRLLSVPAAELPTRYGALLSAVTVALLVLSFLGSYAVMRQASASLQTRLEGRRRPLRRAVWPARSSRSHR